MGTRPPGFLCSLLGLGLALTFTSLTSTCSCSAWGLGKVRFVSRKFFRIKLKVKLICT